MRSRKMYALGTWGKFSIVILLAALAAVGALSLIKAQAGNSAEKNSIEARLQALEDRQEIHRLMIDYGRTLDQRDFAGFAGLFTQDAEYGGRGGAGVIKGPAAIAKLLEDVF